MSPDRAEAGTADQAGADPFDTGALRAAVLRSWQESPTRLIEDTNAELDLRLGAYRDRLLVELAQNAADAAAARGSRAAVRVALHAGELRVANTGATLDAAGVAGLASLRASSKQGDAVGRFGVGFAAVLTVTDEPRVVSVGGGVAFSASRTRQAAAAADVPVLRLPWPLPAAEPALPAGFDTEVRLPLRADIVVDELLAVLLAQVPDVLLALPALDSIDVDGSLWTRAVRSDGVVELHGPGGAEQRWLTHAEPEAGYRWAVPVDADGQPSPMDTDLLHAPTPTDERLSLPARLIAELPIEPSRRRVRPGPELDTALGRAAQGYVELLRQVAVPDRLALVPTPALPRSDVDGTLRELVAGRLTEQVWLPRADGTPGDPAGARVLAVDSPRLVELLAGTVPGLLAAPVCGARAVRTLSPLGAARLDVADAVDALSAVDRSPRWWQDCYGVLHALLDSGVFPADELGALPVPLADGRTITGPRDTLIPEVSSDALDLLADAGVVGLRLLHPEADHQLLRRLGARDAGAGELLAEPAVLDAVQRSVEDAQAGIDATPLAEAVLRLVADSGSAAGLGALALPARSGWRRADELVLPGSELFEVLDADVFGEDAPLDVVDADFAARTGDSLLTGVGVLDHFAVVEDSEPAGPEHDLADEAEWWEGLDRLPGRLLAVRDLDLVADDAWPAALRMLAADPSTWAALTEPDGHAGWWVARNAVLAGSAPLDWRLPDAVTLAGLFDPLPDVGLGAGLARAAGVRERLEVADAEDAADLLNRLGDPRREIPLALACRAYGLLAGAGIAAEDLPRVDRVRTLTGGVADAGDAAVLDAPWLLAVWRADRLVAAQSWSDAEPLAELLDVPLATERTTARVTSDGDYAAWSGLPAVVEVAAILEIPLAGLAWPGVVLHERLRLTCDGTGYDAAWWVEQRLHAEDSVRGLARAVAWAADRWAGRHLIAALLDSPDAATLLG